MTDEQIPDDVPEADALDQRRPADEEADGNGSDALDAESVEVPEADALDQARAVPADEPDARG